MQTGGNYTPGKADLDPRNLLIERNNHLCCEHPNFESNFKIRFMAADAELFDNDLLNLLFENETQLEKAKTDWIKDLSLSLDP